LSYNPELHHKQSNRWGGYDYSKKGAYFITICTSDKLHIFGKVENETMVLNENGKIVLQEWKKTPIIRKYIELGEFVIMPNHFHCILLFIESQLSEPDNEKNFHLSSNSLGAVIRSFKSSVTSQINKLSNNPKLKIWQSNYYDHVIRDNQDLLNTVDYIRNNPKKWAEDQYFN
jgi:REP element-mobilizing transposase RayT